MFTLFKSSIEKEMDLIIEKIAVNMSNNYKDAAQAEFIRFKEKLDEVVKDKKLSDKKIEAYASLYDDYASKLKGFTHKDQKPYWD